MWVPILEKCYAKIFKSYSNMVSGDSCEAYSILTGAPALTIFVKDANFWE